MANIVKDEKGAYRWVYEFNLFTNPTILLTVLKIFLAIIAGVVVFLIVLIAPDLVRGFADASDIAGIFQIGGAMALLLCGLTLVGYVVYGLMQGGKYCVVFTMDERGVTHKQFSKQFEKAQVVSALNIVAGLATGNPSQIGIGLIASTRNSITSDFSAVRSIKGSRLLRVIKINEPYAKNQVYVDPEDYDFVYDFIREHCPNVE